MDAENRTGAVLCLGAVLALTVIAGCATDRSAGQRISDAAITTEVKTRLATDGNVDAHEIDVDTRNAVVRLSGLVDSEKERHAAEHVARRTDGVKDVINDLRIGEGSVGTTLSDAGITAKVKGRLAADPEVPAHEIDVDTTDGVVTLSGTVETDEVKKEAIHLARTTSGVKDVKDRLEVRQGTF